MYPLRDPTHLCHPREAASLSPSKDLLLKQCCCWWAKGCSDACTAGHLIIEHCRSTAWPALIGGAKDGIVVWSFDCHGARSFCWLILTIPLYVIHMVNKRSLDLLQWCCVHVWFNIYLHATCRQLSKPWTATVSNNEWVCNQSCGKSKFSAR